MWEGIIVGSWAGEKVGLGALGLVRQARSLYAQAMKIDDKVLEGSAYASLGVLHHKVPGWPLGFGDKDKARELRLEARAINPQGIDPNFFCGEFLAETRHPDEAVPDLERALQGPPRPGRAARRCVARSRCPARCRSRPGRPPGGSVRPGARARRVAVAGRR